MSDIAIRVENLSKRYSKHTASSGLGRHVRRWLRGSRSVGIQSSTNVATPGQIAMSDDASHTNSLLAVQEPQSNDFWALKDVSFEVKHGEVIGVIGRNGAGKSTLLKILSKITAPTSGRAHIYGRVGSLLEVGTGFHPELTGRENIFLNGAVLRMSRREIRDKFDEIVDFAEVAEFIDTPVKHYSSGMYMRLAFAVAAHLDPEILIVDEVLAVGDAQFQKKCLGKMGDISRGGRTVVFVSHNMAAVRNFCKHVLIIERGSILFVGDTAVGLSAFQSTMSDGLASAQIRRWSADNGPRNDHILIIDVLVSPSLGDIIDIASGFAIRVRFQTLRRGRAMDATLEIHNHDGVLIIHDGVPITNGRDAVVGGMYEAVFDFPGFILNAGQYDVAIIFGENNRHLLLKIDSAIRFAIDYTGAHQNERPLPGIVRPQLKKTCILADTFPAVRSDY